MTRTVAALLALTCLVPPAPAGEVKLYNLTKDSLFVATNVWAPAYTNSGAGGLSEFVSIPAGWVTGGWRVVKPGESAVVYAGDRPNIDVRVARKSVFTKAFVPPGHQGLSSAWAHEDGFSITENTEKSAPRNKFTAKVGGKNVPAFVDPAAKGFRRLDGFARVPSQHTMVVGLKGVQQSATRSFSWRVDANKVKFLSEFFAAPGGAVVTGFKVNMSSERNTKSIRWTNNDKGVSLSGSVEGDKKLVGGGRGSFIGSVTIFYVNRSETGLGG